VSGVVGGVLLALALVSCTPPSATPPTVSAGEAGAGVVVSGLELPGPPAEVWRGRVVRISDGDTLWVEVTDRGDIGPPEGDDVKLRLLRIDTPELARDGQPAECLAEAATDHLTELVPIGTDVLAAYDVEALDRFGRDLVHLWTTDGSWVNGRMLLDGYARVVTFPPNEAFTDEVLAAERAARDAGAGLWSPANC